jgi:hypothetical protein
MHHPVKVYPLTGLKARNANFGGAWRLFVATKHLDEAGRGWVIKAELRAFLARYKVSDRSFRNWLADALALGIVIPSENRPGVLYAVSTERMAATLGCERVDKCPVHVSPRKIFGKGWHLLVWSAYVRANHQGRNVSQATLYRLTGFAPGTQRRWNAPAGVKRRRNVVVSQIPTGHGAGRTQEHIDRPAPFVFYDPRQARAVAAWHTASNNLSTSRGITLAPAGRTRSINRCLSSDRFQRLSILQSSISYAGQPQTVEQVFFKGVSDLDRARKRHILAADRYFKRRWEGKTAKTGVYDAC